MFINKHNESPHKQLPTYLDCDLSKIRSFEKQQEILNILHSEDPDHYSRLYLAGFLKHIGYSLEEICSIIDKEASWEDYDANMTYCQVNSVFRGNDHISSQFRKAATTAENPLQRVFKECTIRSIHVTCYFMDCVSCPLKGDPL